MSDQMINDASQKADEYLACAQEELFKPEEDVVNFMVCKSSYYAVFNYLSLFLLNHKEDVHLYESVEELLNRCIAINPKFKELPLKPLYHPLEEEDVWMDIETSRNFVSLAKDTKELVETVEAG